MDHQHQLPRYLLASFAFILLCFLFTAPSPSIAQAPDPNPGASDSGNPQPPLIFPPSPDSTASEPGYDFISSPDVFACVNSAGNWLLKAPLPAATYGMGVASDGQYVYVAGGYTGSSSDQFLRYNPQTNEWTNLHVMPTAVYDALAVYAQGKIFVFGGLNVESLPVNSVQIYDIASGGWSSGAVMPGVRQQMGGGYYNGKIYVTGGYSTTAVTSASNQTWEYTIATNSWATKANLPNTLGGPASGVIHGHLYIIGGRDIAGLTLNTMYNYDITANTWAVGTPLPTPLNTPGSAVYNNRVWVFGGGDPFLTGEASLPDSPQASSFTYVYDPATNAWSTGPNQQVARSLQGGAVVGRQIISVGGYSAGTSNVVEVLTQELMKILIVYADVHVFPEELRQSILMQAGVGQADAFDGQNATPSLSQLMFYDVVVVFSNSGFADSIILGDNLAVYQDNGGIVVPLVFSWYEGINISGDWWAVGYSPFTFGSLLFSNASLGSYSAGSPLMLGVNDLNAYFRLNLTPSAGAVQVATWSDGQALIAYKGRAVGINAYLGDYSDNWSGDFGRVIVNAGNWLWLGNRTCEALVCTAPKVIQGTLTAGDLAQTDRLFRDDPSSTCAAPLTCPGITVAGTLNFDQYQFLNNSSTAQCVTVTLDTGLCVDGTSVHSSAYLNTYNPTSLCTNYLADIGSSPLPLKSYSFTVPAWQAYTVVVNEVASDPICPNYTLTVSAGDCLLETRLAPLIMKSTP